MIESNIIVGIGSVGGDGVASAGNTLVLSVARHGRAGALLPQALRDALPRFCGDRSPGGGRARAPAAAMSGGIFERRSGDRG